jgi:Type II secretion system (T2SS), protein F
VFDPLYLNSSALGPAVLVVLICGIAGVLLWRLDFMTPPAVFAYRTLAHDLGIRRSRSWSDRLARRLPFLARIKVTTDLNRLLILTGSGESAAAFILKNFVYGLVPAVAIFALDGYSSLAFGQDVVPRILAAVALPIWVLGYVSLMLKVRNLRRDMEIGLGDMIAPLSLIAGTARVNVLSLIQIFATYQRDRTLHSLFQRDRWRTLVELDLGPRRLRELNSMAGVLRAIGDSYEVHLFGTLASTLTQINQNNPDYQTELLALAQAVAKQRQQQADELAATAQSKIKVPLSLLVFPLLTIIIVPLAAKVVGF